MRNKNRGKYWLSQRAGSSAYYVSWFDATTRQTRRASLGTHDVQAAELALARWILEHERPRNERPEDMTVDEVLVRYYRNHASAIKSAEAARGNSAILSALLAGATV